MPKTMIMSLGGSPEPLTRSIEANRPERIVFLASHDSVGLAGAVFEPLDFKPHAEYEITEDPNILFECYRAARRCVDRVTRYGIEPRDVTIDYTGGTKVMTAAVILATVGKPYGFNYVGGRERNKGGLGTVMDGREKLFREMSPWSVFAEEERRQVVTLFNRRRFAAVLEIIERCSWDLPVRIENYFRFVQPMAEGFLFWEQFKHAATLRRLDQGLLALKGYIKAYPDADLDAFSKQVGECRTFLDRVVANTDGLKKLHFLLVEDLLNNARRRVMDRRYDDATARIYRALELYGQVFFERVAGCSNGKVRPEIIPEELREEFVRKYRDPGKRLLKLPLTATFRYLKSVGHDVGKRYFERAEEIKKITSNRNESILAHGIKPISEHAIDTIFKTVSEFVQVTDFFDFPALP
ncbi:MAG: TIGR02710 family CRISPR-associated protein [Desulfobacterales bacterium]|nr:TIGR02710 family CRISPR-associated protein [Desulfobacterales bacterium]